MRYLLFVALLFACTKESGESNESGFFSSTLDALTEDDTDFIDTADAVRPDEDDVDEVNPLNQCGFDTDDTETPFFEQSMAYSFERVLNGGLAEIGVSVDAKVSISSSQVDNLFTFDLRVTGSRATDFTGPTPQPIADTSIVTEGASEETDKFSGEVYSEAFPLRSNFDPEWDAILCTLPGANFIRTTLGGFETEVKFEPGYPAALSPAADEERYDEEIGNYRMFTEIKATVIKTNNPDLKQGQTYIGSVLVDRIEPSLKTPSGNIITADRAYRMTYRFGTEEETRGLGLLIWNEVYIDHDNKKYAAMKSNMGSQSAINFFLPD